MQLYLAGEYYKNMGNAVKQIVWGGIVPEVVDDSILSRSNNGRKPLERRQIQTDWGGTGSINENAPCKPSYDNEIQKRATNGDYPIRGGIPDKIDENIYSRHSSVWGG